MHWLTMDANAAASRLLEDNDANDVLPAKTAFTAALIILVITVFCVIVLVAIQYIRERDLLCATGRSDDIGWTESLSKSIFPDAIMGGSDASVKQTAILDARYNLQTLVFALLQVLCSMLILGGIQVDFQLTWVIVLSAVACWTCYVGIFMTIWMSYVAEDESNGANYASDYKLRELKVEMHTNPISFARHFVELSFFKPMIKSAEITANDIYQDIGRDGSRTFLLGVGQIILLGMYTWSIVDDGKPDLSDERIYMFYCLGILMQTAYLSGQDAFYKSVYSHWTFWGNVFCAARKKRAYTWEPPNHLLYHRPRMAMSGSVRRFNSEACVRLRNTPFLYFRFLFSTIVNVGGLSVLSLLLPLQLASDGNPLSFVLSAVGAYYILEIDNYSDPVTYTLVDERTPIRPIRMEMPPVGAAGHGHNDLESGTTPPDDLGYSFYTSY